MTVLAKTEIRTETNLKVWFYVGSVVHLETKINALTKISSFYEANMEL